MKTRILVAALAVTVSTITLSSSAQAEDPLTKRCATTDNLNCSADTTVVNEWDGEEFCQTFPLGPQRCEVYWPFVNPRINEQAAVGDTTLSWELPSEAVGPVALGPTPREAELQAKLAAKDRHIARMDRRIDRLHAKVERLRDRLHNHH